MPRRTDSRAKMIRAAAELFRQRGYHATTFSDVVRGISIRTLATAAGLSPSRVHQLVAGAGHDALDAAPGELRAAGWPARNIGAAGRTPN